MTSHPLPVLDHSRPLSSSFDSAQHRLESEGELLLTNGASNDSVDRALGSSAAPRLRLLGAKTWGPLYRLLPDLTRSDHFPFWNAGVRAALWTDTGNFRNPNYHRATDTPETLDYVFMTEIAELLSTMLSRQS